MDNIDLQHQISQYESKLVQQIEDSLIKQSSNKVEIVTDAGHYDIKNEKRSIFPYIWNHKWGLMNRNGKVIILPKFDYIESVQNNSILFLVGTIYVYGSNRQNGSVYTGHCYKYGVIDTQGNILLESNYRMIIPSKEGNVFTVQSMDNQYGVFDVSGKKIVLCDSYVWIDRFSNGFTRVLGKNKKWGIIDEQGRVILPLEYDHINRFWGSELNQTRIRKDGVTQDMNLHDLKKTFTQNYSIKILKTMTVSEFKKEQCADSLNVYSADDYYFFICGEQKGFIFTNNRPLNEVLSEPLVSYCLGEVTAKTPNGKNWLLHKKGDCPDSFPNEHRKTISVRCDERWFDNDHYDDYEGSYAQDVMGYSDEFIDDVFDGDPEAYWNID